MTPRGSTAAVLAMVAVLGGCDARATPPDRAPVLRPGTALSDSSFAALHARLSEEGGFFDTDNLISNETGYLHVVGTLEARGVRGGAYIGVGPDQNYSYLAAIRPEVAFMVDIRRDNTLHHLLLKALVERAPTRVEFLAGLHGRPAPEDPTEWMGRTVDEIVRWVDGHDADPEVVAALQAEVEAAVRGYGIPVDAEDLATIRRFHDTFVGAGLGLRFTSLGRQPRSYYPTYRQLVLERDLSGRQASWLASREAYEAVRDLHLANRIVPVVGDLAGPHAVREIGRLIEETGRELSAFYASNVEFYLWRGGTFDAWAANLASLPAAVDAVVIRSYFPNFGGQHPSAIPGYYATQTLQPVATVVEAADGDGFTSYWDVVTRDAVDLRVPVGR